MKIDWILAFTAPIYDVLRKTDTDMASLHLVYGMWDSMIGKCEKGHIPTWKEDKSWIFIIFQGSRVNINWSLD